MNETTLTASVFSFGPITLKRTPEGRIQIFVFDTGVELEGGEVAMLRDRMNVEAGHHGE
jgi:hypothetical protein